MEKKYKNKIIFLINILCLPLGIHALGFQGFATSDDFRAQQQADEQNSQGSSNQYGQNCPTPDCSQCPNNENNSSNLYIPPFTVQILDKSQKTLNSSGKLLTINSSSSAALIVQIFPASNNISNSSVSFIGEKNHLVMYTVKDLLGATVLVDYDLIESSQGIPCYINIPSVLGVSGQSNNDSQTETTAQAGINATSGSSAAKISLFQSLFSSNNTPPADTVTLTILNGLSPLTQKFIINLSNNQNFNITPISGSTDSEVSQVSTISGVTSLKNMSISFNDAQQTTLFTFNENTLSFDSNLKNGVTLNVLIYPADSNNYYQAVATLRSSDGSKYRKQYALTSKATYQGSISPLTSLPSMITISGSGIPNSATRRFFNSDTASNSPTFFNFTAPISLQFRITS